MSRGARHHPILITLASPSRTHSFYSSICWCTTQHRRAQPWLLSAQTKFTVKFNQVCLQKPHQILLPISGLLLDSAGLPVVWLIGSLLTALWLLLVHSPCFLASGFSYLYNQPNQTYCPQVPGPAWPSASLVSPNLRTLHQPFPPQECHSMAAPHLYFDPQPHYVLISRRSAPAATSYTCSWSHSQATRRHSVTRQTSQTTLNIEEMRPLRLSRRLCHYSLEILPKP